MPVGIIGNEGDVFTDMGGYWDGTVSTINNYGFNSAHKRAIMLLPETTSPAALSDGIPNDDGWWHFELNCPPGSNGTGGNYFYFEATNGVTLLRMRSLNNAVGGVLELQTGANVWTNLSGAAGIAMGNGAAGVRAARRIDVYIKIGGAGVGRVRLIINGASFADYTGATNANGVTQIRRVYYGQPDRFVGVGAVCGFAQTLGDDSTVGHSVITAAATAIGTHAAWTGGLTDINEIVNNDGTAIEATSSGLVESFVIADVPSGVSSIRAVVVSGLGSRGASGPQNVEMGFVISGALQLGAAQLLPASLAVVQRVFEVNPATNAAWTIPEVNAAEMALRSAT